MEVCCWCQEEGGCHRGKVARPLHIASYRHYLLLLTAVWLAPA